MSISGEKARRPLTFPDTMWEELDDEAKKEKVTVSELVLRYIALGRESPSTISQATDRRLEQLSDEVHENSIDLKEIRSQIGVFVVVLEELKAQQSASSASTDSMRSKAEELQRWYAMNRQYQIAERAEITPDVPQPRGLWAWVRWLCAR